MTAPAFEKFGQLSSVSESDRQTVLAILSKLPADLVKSWDDQLVVKEGHVGGTYYRDLAAALSYLDFVALYTALGYPFPKPEWYDQKCMVNPTTHLASCAYAPGYSCELQYCHN